VWVARAPSGEFVYANDAFNEIMGMGPVAGARAGGYSGPYGIFGRDGKPYPESALPFVRALHEKRTVVVDDIVIQRHDGTRVDVRAFGKPLRDEEGNIAMVMVSFFDITTEVTAEREGASARARLELAVKHAPLIIWSTDADGVITLSEGAGLEAVGVQLGQHVGRSVREVYGDNPAVVENIRRALNGESFSIAPLELGGSVLGGWMGPIKDAAGKITGITGIATDATERHRATQRAARNDRMVAMGTMAASVAHEINNPLAYVLEGLRGMDRELQQLCAELSGSMRIEVRERLQRLLKLIPDVKEGAERVRVITRDLQTFSRPDSGIGAALTDVRRAAEAAVQMLRNQIEARAKLVLDMPRSVTVRGNEPRVVQIFVNLLLNAVQAVCDRPREQQEISVRIKTDRANVIVEVADSGPGIPDELLPRIFEPFVTTKAIGEGTGLGLFVCRNLVHELGGSIEAGNRREGGALLKVTLPRLASGVGPAPEPPQGVAARARILLIDDNVNLGRVMVDALSGEQHHAEVVFSGREAVDKLATGAQFDVVFCDLMMKDMSGMDVYEELKRVRPGAESALVFMTGGVFTEPARKFLASVPNPWIQKPFDVCEQVSRLLALRR
jgi:two-component system, cell cycle sensor histidine kinase and response regulator CckA